MFDLCSCFEPCGARVEGRRRIRRRVTAALVVTLRARYSPPSCANARFADPLHCPPAKAYEIADAGCRGPFRRSRRSIMRSPSFTRIFRWFAGRTSRRRRAGGEGGGCGGGRLERRERRARQLRRPRARRFSEEAALRPKEARRKVRAATALTRRSPPRAREPAGGGREPPCARHRKRRLQERSARSPIRRTTLRTSPRR